MIHQYNCSSILKNKKEVFSSIHSFMNALKYIKNSQSIEELKNTLYIDLLYSDLIKGNDLELIKEKLFLQIRKNVLLLGSRNWIQFIDTFPDYLTELPELKIW